MQHTGAEIVRCSPCATEACQTDGCERGTCAVQSAALGLAIAGALALGYANIFVTAPSPENLKTLFEFAVGGLEQMGYKVRMQPNRLSRTRSSKRPHILLHTQSGGSGAGGGPNTDQRRQ